MVKFSALPVAALLTLAPAAVYAQAPAAATRQLGTVKSVDSGSMTLATSSGATVTIKVAADTQVLQLAPGSTDLKTATPGDIASVAVGDRVLVTSKADDAGSAARVILMKSSAIAARQSAQQADWQRRGTGGIVKAVDGPVLTVASGTRTLKVETTPTTVFRRYADDSVKFEDAKAGTLSQVHPGDQLSVRGASSDDRLTITAEEVVTGTFENLSGVLTSVDAASGTLSLKDLATKKTVTVKVTANSDLRHMPAQAAAAFAARSHPGGEGAAGRPAGSAAPGGTSAASVEAAGAGARPRSAGMDLSRMLARLPVETPAELHPGDTVMIVASQGGGASLTAITLLSGVEQILSATPSGSQPITLSPWNLGGVPEGGGAQ